MAGNYCKTYGGQGSSSHIKFKASKGTPMKTKVVRSGALPKPPFGKPKAE
jgi:hypothetical protein